MTTNRKMHLNLFLQDIGHHEAAWRLPESDPGATVKLDHYQRVAAIAEAAAFDALFLSDVPGLVGAPEFRPIGGLEPTTLLSALAVTTEQIGLIGTVSTTYNEPYDLARRLASLDHISAGRAGWNVVTTAGDAVACNFGVAEQLPHAERYARAAEFVEVARALWDSWDDDAAISDKDAGRFADPARIHAIDHVGECFSVAGPLNVPRSPQAHPVLVQAGASVDGMALAARYAEIVFTASQTLEEAQRFYAGIRERIADAGRDPDGVKVLPGLVPLVGSTEAEAEARELERTFQQLVVIEYGLGYLSNLLEVDLRDAPLDEQLPPVPSEESPSAVKGAQSRAALVAALARREQLTLRELIGRIGTGRGHWTLVGTPEQVADAMESWFANGAADGFDVMPAALPSGLEAFAEQVTPELRRRGLFREGYEGRTLRDHLGLSRPESRFAAPPHHSVRR
jgi:FMN-dependent oxidoreductase (nitrilotriacetate monooxygenase family)